MTITSPFLAACVQMRSGTDETVNVAAMSEMVREAAARGAQYVQTPEMTGMVQRDRKAMFAVLQPEETSPILVAASELAAELGIWLHVGSTAVRISDDKAANRSVLFAPDGTRAAWYDKIHMFDVDLDHGESWRESNAYTPGERCVVTGVGGQRFGLAICYDLRFPQLFREQALAGAKVLTCPSCFTKQTGQIHWHTLLRARAIENGAWIIAAAQGGTHEDGRNTYGHSAIIDPRGRIAAELEGDEPGVILAEIDAAASDAARAAIPNLANARPFQLDIAGNCTPGVSHQLAMVKS